MKKNYSATSFLLIFLGGDIFFVGTMCKLHNATMNMLLTIIGVILGCIGFLILIVNKNNWFEYSPLVILRDYFIY